MTVGKFLHTLSVCPVEREGDPSGAVSRGAAVVSAPFYTGVFAYMLEYEYVRHSETLLQRRSCRICRCVGCEKVYEI